MRLLRFLSDHFTILLNCGDVKRSSWHFFLIIFFIGNQKNFIKSEGAPKHTGFISFVLFADGT
jgi:hypothetical protein